MLELGPLLGIEGDYSYSISVLLTDEVAVDGLQLVIMLGDAIKVYDFSVNERLSNHCLFRFSFDVPQSETSYVINYKLELGGQSLSNKSGDSQWQFVVPGKDTVPKVGFASCNGDHKLLPEEMEQKAFIMWEKLFAAHNKEELDYSFHCLLLGGDQVYADPIWKKVSYFGDKKLLGWRSTKKFVNHKIDAQDLPCFRQQLEEFYENLYLECWSKPEVSKVLASIPTMMMWDDHDIFDGWGSYPEELQNCDIFQEIFKIARRYFQLLQIKTGENGSLISEHDFSQKLSFRNYEIILLDNRSHRTQTKVMSQLQYDRLREIKDGELFKACPGPLADQRVLLFVIPVPIAHLNYKRRAEAWLRWLFKSDFRKSFDDDALDHWDHGDHENEQKTLIDLLYEFGDKFEPKYVHIVSGDVHSAGAGRIVRTTGSERQINQLISSPIVYKPIGRIAQIFVDWASAEVSKIPEYTVKVDRFGIGDNAPMTIYERNFGFLYKAEGHGLKFYLTLENNQEDYCWDQPRKYNPEI